MIGRRAEVRRLRMAYEAADSQFVAVYGRRRIGKTYLVNEVFHNHYSFHAVGMERAGKREQLEAFRLELRNQGWPSCPKLTSWLEAFSELGKMLEGRSESRKVIFLDELPWFDSPCSGFLSAFEHFWNGWACLRKDVLLIACGSATTWIVNKVLHSRGGLHNRVTCQIPLKPFTLRECEEYAAYRQLGFTRKDVVETYMALGGVAYYWSLLQEGLSAAQNFDLLFFGEQDEMRREFGFVFNSLFKMPTLHVSIVRLLGKQKSGMTRDAIVRKLGTTSGGALSECLNELVQCGFLRCYNSIDKAKSGGVYQLIDPYCLFYFEFIETWKGCDSNHWVKNLASPRVNGWRGRAFERVCFWHIPQIKHKLGISGIEANVYSWRGRTEVPDDTAAQIDMLIDRADGVVDVCEIKYSAEPYEMTKEENERIQHRCLVFQKNGHVRRAVRAVLIASAGLKPGKYSGNIMAVVTDDDLFVEVMT